MVLLMLAYVRSVSFHKLISQYYIQLLIFAALLANSTVGPVSLKCFCIKYIIYHLKHR